MAKELLRLSGLVVEAAHWYRESKNDQYSPEQVIFYDEFADRLTGRREFGRKLVHSFLPEDPGVTLEIAAGTGLVSAALASRVPADKLFLNDISPAAVRVLSERMKGKASIETADFLELPYAKSTIDTLICVGGYRYLDQQDVPKFWQEMDRVMQPGGAAIVAEFHPFIRKIKGRVLSEDDLPETISLVSRESLSAHTAELPIHTGKYTVSVLKKN